MRFPSPSLIISTLAFLCILCLASTTVLGYEVTYDSRALVIDGKRQLILSGSIHYPRSTPEMWPDLIQKAQEGGLNAIETYVFWDIHEPEPRQYDFDGNRDLVRFIKTIHDAGLYAILRIGPYVCAEWNYGGFPVWLHQIPGIELRTDNEKFKNEMEIFTTLVVNKMKEEKLFAPQGGPIILTQIENEYGDFMKEYGEAGKRYMEWSARMALSLDVGVPWVMCKQNEAPDPVISTCNGYYCDDFKSKANTPKMWTEHWTGWFQNWGGPNPHRAAEDVAFAVARFFEKDGTLQNYYMYHGGTNFGRTAGGPYITTSYDYDAPLGEYGNLNQPKWGHLKNLHEGLWSIEDALLYGSRSAVQLGNNQWAVIYAINDTSKACFLDNVDTSKDVTVTFEGTQYFVPAWSVSILPDCKTVTYNTAMVTAPTDVLVKKANTAQEQPKNLTWLWNSEFIADTLIGFGTFTDSKLLEQNKIVGTASDYLWYMTSVKFNADDPEYAENMILQVTTQGHVLHAFFNGKLVGSSYGKDGQFSFVLEAPVTVNPARNFITLLSATVGLKNYGAHFDLVPTGIDGGPVKLIGRGNLTRDLTNSSWSYQVGLNGERKKVWLDQGIEWRYDSLPLFRELTWYKTTFEAPIGSDPVVVSFNGLTKGEAWVNGQSIGRYWPSFPVSSKSKCPPCDYRGGYNAEKCTTGCGGVTQEWYHVPRSFLNSTENTLVLFEEFGGNPLDVNFQTVEVGTVCTSASLNEVLKLNCPSGIISKIDFASFGNPQGTCGALSGGSCDSDQTALFTESCVGKSSCEVQVIENSGHQAECGNKLRVQASC